MVDKFSSALREEIPVNMYALAGGVDPGNFLEISSISLNCEASRVSFLNQTLLQIEKYMKNGQPSFQCSV